MLAHLADQVRAAFADPVALGRIDTRHVDQPAYRRVIVRQGRGAHGGTDIVEVGGGCGHLQAPGFSFHQASMSGLCFPTY